MIPPVTLVATILANPQVPGWPSQPRSTLSKRSQEHNEIKRQHHEGPTANLGIVAHTRAPHRWTSREGDHSKNKVVVRPRDDGHGSNASKEENDVHRLVVARNGEGLAHLSLKSHTSLGKHATPRKHRSCKPTDQTPQARSTPREHGAPLRQPNNRASLAHWRGSRSGPAISG